MRKTNLLKFLLLVAVIAIGTVNVCKSQQKTTFNTLTLANIEALINSIENDGGESGGSKHTCYDTFSSADWFHKDDIFIWCYGCVPEKGHNLQDRNQCVSNY